MNGIKKTKAPNQDGFKVKGQTRISWPGTGSTAGGV